MCCLFVYKFNTTMKTKKKEQIKIDKVEYYPNSEVTCSCGASFNVGSTKKTISVEVCSSCHPYYTGTQKLVDTSGRVDKFKDRLAKREKILKDNKPAVKTKTTQADKKKNDTVKDDTKNIVQKGKEKK